MLLKEIKKQISASGPMPLTDYMACCAKAYYQQQETIGAKGDFITAPEISSLFGEMLGIWVLDLWHKLGAPAILNLVELGPGRGTLMKDMQRVVNAGAQGRMALHLHMVEQSPRLQNLQRAQLGHHHIQWYQSVPELLDQAAFSDPVVWIGNEFLDALPIEQYEFHQDAWYPLHVTLQGEGLALERAAMPSDLDLSGIEAAMVYETSPVSQGIMQQALGSIQKHRGGILLIDYGYAAGGGDTLQAVSHHQYVSPFVNPGGDDITAHVNFKELMALVPKGIDTFFMDQGDFLTLMGISIRAELLKKKMSESDRVKMDQSINRLILKKDPSQHMGALFKVLGCVSLNKEG